MKNVNQVLSKLKSLQFRLSYSKSGSSTIKIFPPDSNKPFYSFHNGEKGLHPLKRFAKNNWNIDLTLV